MRRELSSKSPSSRPDNYVEGSVVASRPTVLTKLKPFWDSVNATVNEIIGYAIPNKCTVLCLQGPHTTCHMFRDYDVTESLLNPDQQIDGQADNDTKPQEL